MLSPLSIKRDTGYYLYIRSNQTLSSGCARAMSTELGLPLSYVAQLLYPRTATDEACAPQLCQTYDALLCAQLEMGQVIFSLLSPNSRSRGGQITL